MSEKFDTVPVRRAASVASVPTNPALVRALKCAPCSQRDAVISNIEAGCYALRPEDLETDLVWLEAMPH